MQSSGASKLTEPLTIAVPKGRSMEELAPLFSAAGIPCEGMEGDGRKLVATCGHISYILAKPMDVPTFVEYGAAHLGVAGKDVLLEQGRPVAELLDLGVSRCSLVLAVPRASGLRHVRQLDFHSRVATKYPHITAAYFKEQGIQVEIIPLNGSVELAPVVGLADAIVDITETGRTLIENGLLPIATIASSSLRLVANVVSYRVAYEQIQEMVARLRAVTDNGGGNGKGNGNGGPGHGAGRGRGAAVMQPVVGSVSSGGEPGGVAP